LQHKNGAARPDRFQKKLEVLSMPRILIVTPHRSRLAEFARFLAEQQGIQVAWAEEGKAAIADVLKHPPLAVIVDDDLLDMPGLDLVRRLLPINALINTAVISGQPPEEFHEAAEGLGIMAQLPPNPAKSDALEVLSRLKRLAAQAFARPRR
jgi:DNA-binding NarL/FixJ family response regulator